jgi:hypothetical protein
MEALRVQRAEFIVTGEARKRALLARCGDPKSQVQIAATNLFMVPLLIRPEFAHRGNAAATIAVFGLTLLLAFFVVCALLPLAVRCIVMLRRSWADVTCAVTISADGLELTTGVHTRRVPWSSIAGVTDSGTAFMFKRREALRLPIGVPKSALAQPDELWSQLDGLLVAKRGLMRKPGPRKLITNTAR